MTTGVVIETWALGMCKVEFSTQRRSVRWGQSNTTKSFLSILPTRQNLGRPFNIINVRPWLNYNCFLDQGYFTPPPTYIFPIDGCSFQPWHRLTSAPIFSSTPSSVQFRSEMQSPPSLKKIHTCKYPQTPTYSFSYQILQGRCIYTSPPYMYDYEHYIASSFQGFKERSIFSEEYLLSTTCGPQ